MTSLVLQFTDTARLKRKVTALAEKRPGVYRMLDPAGRVIYVGKAKEVRTRLLSYFRASYPEQKAARIIEATHEIDWDYTHSEFGAYLTELNQIRKYRPVFNVRMNRTRRYAFIKVTGGRAPRILVTGTPARDGAAYYGPLSCAGRVKEGVRVLNDYLGLRDCALDMPITYSEQADLFGGSRRASCLRYEIGTCSGPCGGFVSEVEYMGRVDTARAFLDGRSIRPLDRIIDEMSCAGRRRAFERAARIRDKYEALEWLFGAMQRLRSAVEQLTFVYIDPGRYGDDRAYVIRHATVRGSAPAPHTPIEREAFRALVAEHSGPEPQGPIPAHALEEIVLLLGWFRKHPRALDHTTPLESWLHSG